MRAMTLEKPSPLMICGTAVVTLLVLVLFALSLANNLFGPHGWKWLGVPAFFIAIPILFLLTGSRGVIRAGTPLPKRWPWLRPCRYVVGALAGVCIVATVAGFVGVVVTMGGAGSVNQADFEPSFHYQGPYLLGNQPVSRDRWLAAAVSGQVVWHCGLCGWLLGLVYGALSEPKAPATGPESEAEPVAADRPRPM